MPSNRTPDPEALARWRALAAETMKATRERLARERLKPRPTAHYVRIVWNDAVEDPTDNR